MECSVITPFQRKTKEPVAAVFEFPGRSGGQRLTVTAQCQIIMLMRRRVCLPVFNALSVFNLLVFSSQIVFQTARLKKYIILSKLFDTIIVTVFI